LRRGGVKKWNGEMQQGDDTTPQRVVTRMFHGIARPACAGTPNSASTQMTTFLRTFQSRLSGPTCCGSQSRAPSVAAAPGWGDRALLRRDIRAGIQPRDSTGLTSSPVESIVASIIAERRRSYAGIRY